MIIVLDANAVLSDPHFKHKNWQLLVKAVKAGFARVCVPTVVFDEVCHHYPNMRARILADLEKTSRHLRGEALDLVRRAIELTAADAAGYGDRLRELIDLMEFELLPSPQVDHEELARMALNRVRPFDESGTGYRDSLVWMSLIELIYEDRDNDFALVSMDKKAFQDDHGELHADLIRQASEVLGDLGSVRLVRALSKIPIPGKYRGDSWIPPIHEDLGDFLMSEINNGNAAPVDLKPFDLRLDEADLIDDFDLAHVWIRDLEARELSGTREVEIKFVGDGVGVVYFSRLWADEDGQRFDRYVTELKIRLNGTMYTAEHGEVFSHIEDFSIGLYEGNEDGMTPLDGLALEPHEL